VGISYFLMSKGTSPIDVVSNAYSIARLDEVSNEEINDNCRLTRRLSRHRRVASGLRRCKGIRREELITRG